MLTTRVSTSNSSRRAPMKLSAHKCSSLAKTSCSRIVNPSEGRLARNTSTRSRPTYSPASGWSPGLPDHVLGDQRGDGVEVTLAKRLHGPVVGQCVRMIVTHSQRSSPPIRPPGTAAAPAPAVGRHRPAPRPFWTVPPPPQERRSSAPADRGGLVVASPLVEPDTKVHHRREFILAGAVDRLRMLAASGMRSSRRPRPAPGSGVVGGRPDGPPFREQGQDVEGGTLTLRGVSGQGDSPLSDLAPRPAVRASRSLDPMGAVLNGIRFGRERHDVGCGEFPPATRRIGQPRLVFGLASSR